MGMGKLGVLAKRIWDLIGGNATWDMLKWVWEHTPWRYVVSSFTFITATIAAYLGWLAQLPGYQLFLLILITVILCLGLIALIVEIGFKIHTWWQREQQINLTEQKQTEAANSVAKVHNTPPSPGKIINRKTRTNAELQQEALEKVQKIRDCLEQHNRDEHLQNSTPMSLPGISQATKHLLWDQRDEERRQLNIRFMANYKKQFLVDVILLRDELKRRLPHTEEETDRFYIKELYENPVNPSGIETVMIDLERLAKSLPPSA